jgi:Flp pilus assembly protein TadD/predicted Ser/Thr protein kinase
MSNDSISLPSSGQPVTLTVSPPIEPEAAYPIPSAIGHYRIIRLLGQGGMGAVYEAEQESPRRKVALKVIRPGLADPTLLRRFEQEAEALGRLQHPGIAQIYEAGTADSGFGAQPYFAMEFIHGKTMNEYVRQQRLSLPQRLELMAKICEAVHHAHERGLIHRDLKPGNIVVDETGQPKILDFGVARVTDSDSQATRQTDLGQIVGTLAYMSPEQVLADPLELDTRSDVYALGVIFYELLAGRRPYDVSGAKVHEAVQTIRDTDPERLSSIQRVYRGDVETITTKALEKDKGRRYRSAGDMAGDIRRYLANEPIIARPPSAGYRLQKFYQRHRIAVIGTVAAVALAALSAALTYRQATGPKETLRLSVQPIEAASPDAIVAARALSKELTTKIGKLHGDSRKRFAMAGAADKGPVSATHVFSGTLAKHEGGWVVNATLADTRSGGTVKSWSARYANNQINYASGALGGFVSETLDLPPLEAKPTVKAAALPDYNSALAYIRTNLRVDDALAAARRATAEDPDSALVYAVRAETEWLKYFLSNDAVWKKRMEESVQEAEIRNPDLAPVHRITGLIEARAGNYELAETHYRRAIKLDPLDGDAYRRLGDVYEDNNQINEARGAFQRALELDPGYFRLQQDVGSFYLDQTLYREALPYFAKAVELAPEEPNPRFALAVDYENLGRFEDAERELRKALSLRETTNALHTLGIVLMYERREAEAIPFLERTVKQEPQRYLAWLDLGICYRRTNRSGLASAAFKQGLRAAETEMAKNPRSGYVRSFLAYLCTATGDRERAESEVAQALQLSPTNADVRWIAVLTDEALGRRDAALAVLNGSTAEDIANVNRWPDAEALRADARFQELLATKRFAENPIGK